MEDHDHILDKILAGLKLSYERLIDKTAKEDGELIIADQDGKLVRVKAKELKEQRQKKVIEQEKQA